jgi:hypothetical protein
VGATCNSCEAPIVWARTEAKEAKDGKAAKPSRSMPIDADPDTGAMAVPGNGNLVKIGEDRGQPVVRYVPKGKGLHVSHFATCPNGPAHRKAKR